MGSRDPIVDLDAERHERVLESIASHPLVRHIHMPIQMDLANQEKISNRNILQSMDEMVEISNPEPEGNYPVVGVIDSGVGPILDSWVIDRFDYLQPSNYDAEHGTSVAGLLISGKKMNNLNIIPDPDGCKIWDIPLFPRGGSQSFLREYRNGFGDFLQEVEEGVAEACAKGVRIFNLSINVIAEVKDYGVYAAQLDKIADKYKVLFVNSAGNLENSEARKSWAKKQKDVINYFARRSDTIRPPSESVRSISVGALNPPGTSELAETPTRYTTRGPGLRSGVKPDVATYGGSIDRSSGLFSIDLQGHKTSVHGTSFAAPLVARIIANLDATTQNSLTLEALRAMLIHHASIPSPLRSRLLAFREIVRGFVGFGKPIASNQMLETGDHQITMLFQGILTISENKPSILRFDFSWPQSLVNQDNGGCIGKVRMTLVYAPPLNRNFGDEFVRVNLDAKLSQRQLEITRKDGNPSYINQIKPKDSWGSREKVLIKHGLKWWPVKQYESTFTSQGDTSNWRLQLECLVRAEDTFPVKGVPFAIVLTIEDPDGTRPIFSEMRQLLEASGAILQDIRPNIRLRP
ncbi:MAG: S8 family peptidase [Aestuariivita sp.]|nr:S8 family peptidase [Aestuariivita sp.]